MDSSSRLSACLLLCMVLLSSVQTLACGTCPPSKPPKVPKRPIRVPPVIGKPPIVLPPIIGKPPITLPPVPVVTPVLPPIIGKPPVLPPVIKKPPVVLPPVIGKPPVVLPPVPVVTPVLPPIIGKPPVVLPPVPVVTPVLPPIIGKPPITLPPVPVVTPILPPVIGGTPKAPGGGCPPPKAPETCPLDTIKLVYCIDILGVLPVHIGEPAVNKCCPLVQGVAGLEAALCLCTTIKTKLLNVKLFLPLALELLVSCGKAPPPGFTCP